MPTIVVFSSEDQGPYLAAAVMAATLSRASQPLKGPGQQHEGARAERTRPRNPNSLTVNQHVFPSKSIGRFADQSGRVSVHDLRRDKVFRTRPGNSIFYADRAWDQRAESGYMKRIEDDFQRLVAPIVDGKVQTIPTEAKAAIDGFFALWYMRSRYREIESQEIELNGIFGGNLTKEQEENLEKNGYTFVRNSGKMPARQLNGVELQMRTGNYARDLASSVTRWGVIAAQSGEFVVPDVPSHGIIPLAPRLALVQSAPDGMITERNLAEINLAMRATSQDYFFARDFSSCPFS